jgi:hypothetical protein
MAASAVDGQFHIRVDSWYAHSGNVGTRDNNLKFSPCSRQAIGQLLSQKVFASYICCNRDINDSCACSRRALSVLQLLSVATIVGKPVAQMQ